MAPTPTIVDHCGDLLEAYDVLLCDVWGVVHDGNRAFPAANEALAEFRNRGGTVILVSNAPTPSTNVARVLDEKGVVRDAWDAIISSGDIALGYIGSRGWERLHIIGPGARDRAFFEAAGLPLADLDSADGLAVTGLVDDRRETAADYRPRLEIALSRNLELVCANPDLVVHVGDALLPCAGALGQLYEQMGGRVFWAGKPFPIAYDRALAEAARRRGGDTPGSRCLAIGDSIRTDLAAAQNAGVDALFIASGIHREEAMENDQLSPEGLAKLFSAGNPPARYAARALVL
ncbi:MAG: TIGR01459 family HAD-type hydrolase [Proteobacteria bacterium]|nr:TIGR01459 family HAD-type hydrolase [Pseudomonadota bacterium]